MNIHDPVKKAQAFQDQAVRAYRSVRDVRVLELLRAESKDDVERRRLDLVILLRKRAAKAEFEAIEREADFWDKAALPCAAAIPGLLNLLAGASVANDPLWRAANVACCVAGAVVWLLCRLAALNQSKRAKAGLADLGKVD